jgi:hypothetical protein
MQELELKKDIYRLPDQMRSTLYTTVSKRGESVLRFAHIVNEMKRQQPSLKLLSFQELPFANLVILSVVWCFVPFAVFYGFQRWAISSKLIFFVVILIITLLAHSNFFSWWTSDFKQNFNFYAENAIRLSKATFNLPAQDLPSAHQLRDAYYESGINDFSELFAPSTDTVTECNLLGNNDPTGTNPCHLLRAWTVSFMKSDTYIVQKSTGRSYLLSRQNTR